MRLFIPVFFKAPLGGLHLHTRSQCRALKTAGHTPIVMCRPGRFSEILQHDGVDVIEDNFGDIASATSRALAGGPFDIVHAHPFFSRLVGQNVAKFGKIPFVVTFHGPYLDQLSEWHDEVNLIIAVSTATRDELVGKTPVDPAKVIVIPNGADTRIYSRQKGLVDGSEAARQNRGNKGEPPQVIFASRFDKDKRFVIDAVLETWRICIQKGVTPVDWLVAGNGALREDMEAVAAELNSVASRRAVTFLGWHDEATLAKLYAHADLCVGPGRCAIDAMACGTPVIALGSRGYVGLIDERRIASGIYSNFGGFRGERPEYLAGTLFSDLESVIYDQERLRTLGETSAALVQAFFSQEKLDEQLLALYASLSSRTASTTVPKHAARELIKPNQLHLSSIDSATNQRELGFLARPGMARWPLAMCIDWTADPFNDSNWRFCLSAWRMMDPLIKEFIETQRVSILRELLDIALDWYEFNIAGGASHAMLWHDMAVGLRAMRLAFLLQQRTVGNLVASAEEMRTLARITDLHLEKLTTPEFIAPNNHGIFQVFGLALLVGQVPEHPRSQGAIAFAQEQLALIFDRSFTDEGVHKESSPEYHRFVWSSFHKLSQSSDIGGPLQTILHKAAQIEPWLTLPNGFFAATGDSQNDKRGAVLIKVEPDFVVELETQKYAVRDLSRSGYVVIRSMPDSPVDRQSMMFLTGMSYTRTHKHADELSFILYEFGRLIFVDPGKYGYVYDETRAYFCSANAHNTISVDDTMVGPHALLPIQGSCLDAVRTEDGAFVLGGTIERPGLFRQTREIRYVPGRSLLVSDHVVSHQPRTFISSLHLAPDLEPVVVGGDKSFQIQLGPHMISITPEGHDAVDTVRGQQSPMAGWYSPSYLKAVPTTVLRASTQGNSANIGWRVSLS